MPVPVAAVDGLAQTRPVADAASLDRRLVFAAVAGNLLGAEQAPVTIGRFVVLERLGSGNFGTVWLAFDPKLQRRIALKLALAPTTDPQVRRRVFREAQAAAALSHPNVVAVHDIGELDGRIFIAMELVAGVTLAQWLRAHRRSWRDIVALFAAIGRGLQAAHDAGVVHRDFKPDNVLVGSDGRPRIVDFGLARGGGDDVTSGAPLHDAALTSISTTAGGRGKMVGTPAYMSPEAFEGRDVGCASDQFAFAVALFEALAGSRPFCGNNVAALASAVVRGQRAPIKLRQVPRALAAAIDRGLASAPSQRFGSMAAFVAALERALGRRRRVALLAAAVAVACAGTSVGVLAAPANDPCASAGAEVDALWGPTQADAITARLGPDAASGVLVAAERYAERWRRSRQDACTATMHRGAQSTATMDLRTACLRQRSVGFGALVTALGDGSAQPTAAVGWLEDGARALDRCDDAAWLHAVSEQRLLARTERTATMAGDARWEPLAEQLELARLEALLGHVARARTLAEAVAAEAADANLRAIEADALTQIATLAMEQGELDAVEPMLDRATALALAAAPADVAIDALLRRVELDQRRGRDHSSARVRLDVAEALLERVPQDDARRSRVLEARGLLARADGDLVAAEGLLTVALELGEAAYAQGHPNLDGLRNNLATVLLQRGRHQQARALWQQVVRDVAARADAAVDAAAPAAFNLGVVALALRDWDDAARRFADAGSSWSQAFGADHPAVALALGGEGEAQRRAGRLAWARALQQRALAIREAALGPDHPDVAVALEELAELDRLEHRFADAHARLDRAQRLRTAAQGEAHPDLAIALRMRAALLCDEGRPREALAAVTTALRLRSQPGLDPAAIPELHALALRAMVLQARSLLQG
ncbi:MAG: serine/threonine-protein kinase [Nannocystaceae bacterium]|nr:serine/threonine-protein kinase [Nannocystaceae bacterium]